MEVPVLWRYLYCGGTCTVEVAVLWRYLYCGGACTVEVDACVTEHYIYKPHM